MKMLENKKIKEKVYAETLENGMKVIIIPKHETRKKYVIWGTKFGSNDNHFIEPETNTEIKVPDGVAHYLEHKMFEQENGVDSLYKLMALGLDANAYTTNDHTAYLFSGTDNFYEGLDELMDYVQHPYFTDENVEKERGIIGQEIQRYDDEPAWKLYMNTMQCLYKNNPITIDTAGTIESISHITKETLYSCYNTFYHPSNMIMCICGDFDPEKIIEEVKKRLIPRKPISEIKRIYPKYEDRINQKYKESIMDINMPMFMIGYRDFIKDEDMIKKDIAIKIIFNSILGKCSDLYQNLYEKGLLLSEMDCDFDFSDEYSHIIISGESKNPKKVYEEVVKKLANIKIEQENFERSKKRLLGEFISDYDDVEQIGRMFLADSIRNINTLEYIDKIQEVSIDYVEKIRNKMFTENESVLSVINPK